MDLDEAIQHAKDVSLQCETTDPLCSAEHGSIPDKTPAKNLLPV